MSNEVINEEINETNEQAADETVVEPERAVVIEEAIEAILFAAGHPISYATLARVFESTPSKIRDIVFDYALKYNNSDVPRGVLLLTFSDSCQLCTKQHYLTEIREALGIKKSGTLSTSALETLAIIAYNQPVTRIFVDTLRKVDSSYAMNSLIDRGLIECVGRLDVPGRPMQYGTTSDFLRCFGLKSIEDLPSASEELINMFEKTKEKEEAEINIDEDQMTISDLENQPPSDSAEESQNDNSNQNEDPEEIHTESSDTADFDEPSAEDDIQDFE